MRKKGEPIMELSTGLLSELHSGAVSQIDNEFFKLGTFLRDEATPEEIRVLNAALNLRRLNYGIWACELHDLVFGLDGGNARYSCLYRVADSSHFSTVAKDLLKLVERLFFDVMDNGCLRLIRVKMNSLSFKTGEDKDHLIYFLSGREDLTMKRIEEAVSRHSVWPFRIVGVKDMWFGSLGKFASFLGLLADGFDSNDPFQDKLARKIDDLMKPETYEDWKER